MIPTILVRTSQRLSTCQKYARRLLDCGDIGVCRVGLFLNSTTTALLRLEA